MLIQLHYNYNLDIILFTLQEVYFGTFENDADLNITNIVTKSGGVSAAYFQIITISKTIINKDNKNEYV